MRLPLVCLAVIATSIGLGSCKQHRKVLLGDVKTLTLVRNENTEGRRSVVPQLSCVGGSARGRYEPRVVQCTQTGHDGIDYQWRCSADLPHEYELGKVTVTCEGFDYPEDPYVTHGSCGLEYFLEYRSDYKGSQYGVQHGSESGIMDKIGVFLVVALIVIVVIWTCSGAGNTGAQRPGGAGGPGGYGGPGYPSDPPPPYDSFPSSKPSSSYSQRQQPQAQNDGPGFWSGAGLGAAAGYMFGRNQGGQRNEYRAPQYSQPRASSSFMGADTSASTSTTESTSYGGTRRR